MATINVVVKSEPKGEAKGRFQCEITGKGLLLKQSKKRTIKIPVGTPARYERDNKLAVKLETYKLEIAVQKFGSYQNRLARDLARFIAGKRSVPRLDDYKLEWYFYVLPLLPLGVPIITLGGAIPGAIGGGLAGGGFYVAQQEQLPKWARILIILGFSAAAYALLFVLIAMAVLGGAFGQ